MFDISGSALDRMSLIQLEMAERMSERVEVEEVESSPGEDDVCLAACCASELICTAADSDLTPEEEELLERLKERDLEVRMHEEAHRAALGPYAVGGPIYTYQPGPDGKMYAIGGRIAADVGAEATPEETRRKAAQLRHAAVGVVEEPSAADAAIAAHANRMELEAAAAGA